jgi:hypothetical protein
VEEQPDVGSVMKAYAEDAVSHAKAAFDIDLDFSDESVERVEGVLGKLYENIPRGFLARLFRKGPSEADIEQMSKAYGGYIGEVLCRNSGGRWKLGSDAFPGERIITLELPHGGDAWPHFKVGKRLSNGPEDNVWHYFTLAKKGFQG